ncbi:MAG: sulfotransferase family protein [Fibrobacterota bacterium]
MDSGYFITGINTRNLLRLVARNGISLRPHYISRLLFLFNCSVPTSFFSLFDKIGYEKKIREISTPEDPVFIVGHWRTGSTFLHQLLNLSPHMAAPTLFQIGAPESFLSSRKILYPLIKPFLTPRRTVDNVALGLEEPQEDEYALFRMTTISPVEELIFPKSNRFFLSGVDDYMPKEEEDKKKWKDSFRLFYRKLAFKTGKRLVFKNPFHSMRIPVLASMFPKAKFIHIHRNPLSVIPSTMHMWSVVGRQNALRDEIRAPRLEEVVDVYDKMMWKVRSDLQKLPEEQHHQIRFDELEEDVPGMISGICRFLHIPFNQIYKQNLSSFKRRVGSYRKNRYALTDSDKQYIRKKLKHHMVHFGYISNESCHHHYCSGSGIDSAVGT